VEGLKELNAEKERLKCRYDFSRLDAFRALDRYKMNSLLRDDIRLFMNIHGHNASALDADHIMRRLDQDRDGRITYSEFVDYIDQVHLGSLSS
jgi:Ca2+-binding EF-hand superfamily protein